MALLRAIEICAFLVLMYGIVTQVALPLITNKPLFPFFTLRKQRRLEKQLADLRHRRREYQLSEQIVEENKLIFEDERRRLQQLLDDHNKRKGETTQ